MNSLLRHNAPAPTAPAGTEELFSPAGLRAMIVPLFLEQLLVMLVGMSDTLVVSHAGEAAVSGVSLVNQFNNIFIYLFTALASGGSVVISQYLGRGEPGNAGRSASQLLLFAALFSTLAGALILLGNERILRLMFGRTEEDVMRKCVTYLRISAYSYPAIAIYSAGAALFRSLGRARVTLYLSAAANVINIAGNLVGVFWLHAGVAGVAYPSLLARTFSAAAVTLLCFRVRGGAACRVRWVFQTDGGIMRRILGVAVPNGLENGTFQLVKVALSSVVALFGTSQIAANGAAQSIWSLAALAGTAMGPAFIAVIGRCMGGGDTRAADFYFRRLIKLTLLFSSAWNLFILLLTPPLMALYALEPETKRLVIRLVLIHNVFNATAFPLSGALSDGLRAAGDVKFTMCVSVFSTAAVRLLLSCLLGIGLGLGVTGIALAMASDWVFRAAVFYGRMRSGRWKAFRVV